uniref:Uncharacterized protein n=1 Tax=Avena sativa TaxID=4498 RepID=A0ACD5VTH8_AVESA
MTSTIMGETAYVIRQLVLPHTCGKTNESSRINSVWLSKNYKDQIRSDPDMKISAFMDMVRKGYDVSISKHMAYRAKNKAIVSINGHHEQQYYRLRDYLQTVLNTNPGSRCMHNWPILLLACTSGRILTRLQTIYW